MSEEGNLKLSKALSLEELHKALKGMESGKAPGIDSLPVDFYKSFWSVLNENFGIWSGWTQLHVENFRSIWF